MQEEKIKKLQNKINKKNSYSNISEFQITKNDEIAKKDEIIKKLREKIIYLENKIKILEKGKIKIKSRNTSLNNTLIFKTDKTKKIYLRTQNIYNTKLIPLDKELLKAKLNKKKKNLVEFLDVKKIIQKNKNHSYYNSETAEEFCNKITKGNAHFHTHHPEYIGTVKFRIQYFFQLNKKTEEKIHILEKCSGIKIKN